MKAISRFVIHDFDLLEAECSAPRAAAIPVCDTGHGGYAMPEPEFLHREAGLRFITLEKLPLSIVALAMATNGVRT